MSTLKKCRACGNPVSANAAACPHCGEPVNLSHAGDGRINLRDPIHVIGVVVALIAAALFIVMIVGAFVGGL